MRLFRILALSGLAFLLCVFMAACGGSSTPPSPPTAPTITSTTLPIGAVNAPYSAFLTAANGNPPFTWTVTAGSLPPGLSIQMGSEIAGTPTTFGKYPFTVKVTDTKNLTATSNVSITIEGLVLIDCNSCGSGTMTLPSGNPGVPYSAMLTASGGKAPYTWSVASGSTLPAGLMISTDSNGNGIISGTPTTPGPPMMFTVQATDSESTPSTGTAILSLTIIQISTTSLPNATLNASYNATLTAVGGQSNYTWSIVGGSLPTGLSISNSSCINSKNPTCSITGTATGTLGIYPVTFQVSDGGNPPAKATSMNLSIDLQGPKLIITTSSEPPGTVGQPYSGQLQASGGILPLSWCIIERNGNCDDGSGGAFPPGLKLDQTTCNDSQMACQIVGTPTSCGDPCPHSYPFIPRVQDSENPPQIVTGTLPLTITINPAMNNGSLSGNYAFSFDGYQSGNPVLMAGAFLADGGGNLRIGKLDVNDGSGEAIDNHGFVIPQTIGAGSVYSINRDGTGTMTVVTTQTTYKFDIVLASSGCTAATSSQVCGRLIESDPSQLQSYGSGTIRAQDSTFFVSTSIFPGTFATRFTGIDSQSNRYAGVGAFAVNAQDTLDCNGNGWGLPNGCPADIDDAGTAAPGNFLGSFDSTIDPQTGRGGFVNLTFNGDTNDVFTYAYYVINKNELILISADPLSKPANMTLWSVNRQTSSATGWTLSSLRGAGVLELQGVDPNNGTPLADVTAGLFTPDGNGNATFASDGNDGGTISQQSSSGTYTVDSKTGRVALTGFAAQFNSTPPVLYLYGPNNAYVVGTDPVVNFGLLEPQSGTSFSKASIIGNYAGGSSWPALAAITNSVTAMSANGAGNITSTQFTSGPGGPTGPNSLSLTYQVDATGRATVTQNANPFGIMYVVSPNKVILLPSGTDPVLNVFSSGASGSN